MSRQCWLIQNITALALAAKVLPRSLYQIMTVLLNIFAYIDWPFLGIYLGFQDALKGIVRKYCFSVYSRENK